MRAQTGIVLEPTKGNQRAKIMTALDQLSAGGRTNGAAGIRLAYSLAQDAFVENGINRVVLATDGDFNVGTVDFEAPGRSGKGPPPKRHFADNARFSVPAITTIT